MSNGKHLVKCSHTLQVQVKWATASYHLYRITNMCKERKCDQVPAKVVLLGNNHTSWQFINTQGRSVFIWSPSNIQASLLILSHRFFYRERWRLYQGGTLTGGKISLIEYETKKGFNHMWVKRLVSRRVFIYIDCKLRSC